ncbi:MAG: YegS/Rv2252/BmrU family lipid kinase [Cyclobacteriaceae bacterium]
MNGAQDGKKNAVIILNGISLKKKLFYHDYLPALSQIFNVEVHETLSKNDARSLASKFTDKYADLIIAAGGDGTLHQVVNGILKERENEIRLPAIGLIPIGSGNDFARGAGLKIKPEQSLKIFSAFNLRPIDVGFVEYSLQPSRDSEKGYAYFVNVADIGMGPEVVGKVLNSGRPFGSEVAYYKSILTTFLTYRPMIVKARADQWDWEGKLRTLAVANGQYYGHGLCIAPDAVMDDRLFSVFVCGNVSVLDFIMHTGTLKKGKNIVQEEVWYKTATTVEFSSDHPCPIEGDGEILGWLPAKVGMIERQLNFLI